MKKILYIWLCIPHFAGLLFFSSSLLAQNLVPNPSFEQYDTCPDWFSQINRTITWFQATPGTPDYFNSCDTTWTKYVDVPQNYFGHQNAKTENAYGGLFAFYRNQEYREYIETQLSSPMQIGTKYYVSISVSLADSCIYATDDIGIRFFVDSFIRDTFINIPITPHIENISGNYLINKNNWTIVSGSFIADSAYKYIVIGNFKNNQNSDTMFVSGSTNLVGTDYDNSYYYIDDICVSDDSLICNIETGIFSESEESLINIYPNPANNFIVIQLREKYLYSEGKISIINLLGQEVASMTFNSSFIKINTSLLTSGYYILNINSRNNSKIKKISINKN